MVVVEIVERSVSVGLGLINGAWARTFAPVLDAVRADRDGVELPLLLRHEEASQQRGIPLYDQEGRLHVAAMELGGELLASPVERRGRLVVASELPLAGSRPDLVVAQVELAMWTRRHHAGLRPITAPAPLEIAWQLNRLGGAADLSTLSSRLPTKSRSAIARAVGELLNAGWVLREDGGFILRREAASGLVESAAVEAKVSDWRRAAHQAMTWMGHVDAAWLAFPEPYLHRVPRSEAYLSPLGLVAVNDNNEAHIVRRGALPSPSGARRRQVEEHLYARWVRWTESS